MIHTIHIRPQALGETKEDTVRAVPESTDKRALIAAPFWLARHKLIFELAIYTIVGIAVLIALFTPYFLMAIAFAGLATIYLYLEGNQLRCNALARRGYQLAGIVDTPDEEMALVKYFDGKGVQTRPAPSRPVPVGDDLSFGLFGGTGV